MIYSKVTKEGFFFFPFIASRVSLLNKPFFIQISEPSHADIQPPAESLRRSLMRRVTLSNTYVGRADRRDPRGIQIRFPKPPHLARFY